MAENTTPYGNAPENQNHDQRRRARPRSRAAGGAHASGISYREAAQAHHRATPRQAGAHVRGSAPAARQVPVAPDAREQAYLRPDDAAAHMPPQTAATHPQPAPATEANPAEHQGAPQQHAQVPHEPARLTNISASAGVRPVSGRAAAGRKPPIMAFVVLAAIAVVALFLWNTRSVEITLNGNRTSLRVGSTVDEVVADKGLSPKAGDLISVSGNKLRDGQGYPYVAKLDGNEMDGPTTAAYRVHEGDDLDISDGRDRTEDYDVQVVTDQPKLHMGGDAWGNITYIKQWGKAGSHEVRTGKVSGETADGDVIEPVQDLEVDIHQIKPDNDQKLIALTFDDGPAEGYTEKYLDILNQYGIHATFFNLGQNIDEYPDLSKKVVETGNELMSHTDQHQELTTLDAPSLQKELTSTFDKISSTTGVQTTAFRPPYGSFKESTWLNSGGKTSVSVLWNLDSLDWKRPGVDAIVSNATDNAFSGGIILMHDGGGNRDQDVEALPQIIEKLQGEGYTFVTVGDLIKSDSSLPADITNDPMPDDAVWPTEMAN